MGEEVLEEMKPNEPKRQKLHRQMSCQQVNHAKLYSDKPPEQTVKWIYFTSVTTRA